MKDPVKRLYVFLAINIASLILLGIIMQIGGAYLVNAAVAFLGDFRGAAAGAAAEYSDYMEYIRSFEPRQIGHVIFVAPLVEELVFRLIFLRAGRMLLPFWAANIIQAVLFGIYHGVAIQRVYGMIMGLIIGCIFCYCPVILRKRTKCEIGLLDLPDSLMGYAFAFILHMTINTAGVYIAPLFPADLSLPVQILIGLLLMLIAGGLVYILYRQSIGDHTLVDASDVI